MNILDKISSKECAGCFGCQNSCPYNAIKLELNEEGFYFPKIDKKKCNNCGLCIKNCPVLNNLKENDNYLTPLVFAARTNDSKLLLKSSSGGIFGEVAKEILKQGGKIFGAAWDCNLKLRHLKVSNNDELEKLLGAKYIQSNIGFIYREIAKEAAQRIVLFSGTPCQVKALKLFLMDKSDTVKNNIITCDLICHGVPSTKIFEIYLSFLEKRYKSKISEIYFRNKNKGWGNYYVEAVFKNKKRYKKSHRLDFFMQYFLSDIFLRESCYSCVFSKVPRVGDLTLGDLWGALRKYHNSKGVSVVLVNSIKGKKIIKQLKKNNRIKIKEYPLSQVLISNPRASRHVIKTSRDLSFFQEILNEEESFEGIIKKHIKPNMILYFAFKSKQKIKDLFFSRF